MSKIILIGQDFPKTNHIFPARYTYKLDPSPNSHVHTGSQDRFVSPTSTSIVFTSGATILCGHHKGDRTYVANLAAKLKAQHVKGTSIAKPENEVTEEGKGGVLFL